MSQVKKKIQELKLFLRETRRYMSITGVGTIARRYFVMNSFDGALTVLGIVLGSYAIGVVEPFILISAGLGAGLAMTLSGVWGAYMAETAERTRALKDLENALFTDLKDSLIERAHKVASIWIAFVDGVSPAVITVLSLSPFFLSLYGLMPAERAVYSSVALIMSVLFLLGIYLGFISKENRLVVGFKMILAGIIIAIILFLIRFIL